MSFIDSLDLFLDIYKENKNEQKYNEVLKIKDTILKFKNGSSDTPQEQVNNLITVYCLFAKYTPEKFETLFTHKEQYPNNLENTKQDLLKAFETMRTTIFEFSRKNFI